MVAREDLASPTPEQVVANFSIAGVGYLRSENRAAIPQTAGGFQIPIDFLAGTGHDQYADLKGQVYDAQVKHKLWSKLEVEHGSR